MFSPFFESLNSLNNNETKKLTTNKIKRSSVYKVNSCILSAIQWSDNTYIMGNQDGSIVLVNLKNNALLSLQQYTEHTGSITQLVRINDDTFASASSDGTVRLWNIASSQSKTIIDAHKAPITSLLIWKNKLISSSNDKSIKIWDLEGNLISSLLGHENNVKSLALASENKLISVSTNGDNSIRIWDLMNTECLDTLALTEAFTWKLFSLDNDTFCSLGANGITTWDLNTKSIINTFQPSSGHAINVVNKLDSTRIVIGVDSKVLLLDEKLSLIETANSHKNTISAILPLSNSTFVSFGQDGLIVSNQLEQMEYDFSLVSKKQMC